MRRLLTIVLGIVFIGLGIFILVRGNAIAKRCTVDTVATVIDITRDQSTDSDGFTDFIYYPIIEYKAGDITIQVKDGNGSNPSKYQVNDQIEIKYNPDNVKEYIFKGDKSFNIIGIMAIIAGVLVLFIGVRQLLLGR